MAAYVKFIPSGILAGLFVENNGGSTDDSKFDFEKFQGEIGRNIVKALRLIIGEIASEGYEQHHVILSRETRLLPCFAEKLVRILEIQPAYREVILGTLYQELRPLAKSESLEEPMGVFTIKDGRFVIVLECEEVFA